MAIWRLTTPQTLLAGLKTSKGELTWNKKYIVDAFKKYISVCGNYLTCEECPYHTANQAFDKTLGTNNFRICQSIFLLETMKANAKTRPVKSKYNLLRARIFKRLWRKCSYSYFLNGIKHTKYDYTRISENRIFKTYEEAANAVYHKTEAIKHKEI